MTESLTRANDVDLSAHDTGTDVRDARTTRRTQVVAGRVRKIETVSRPSGDYRLYWLWGCSKPLALSLKYYCGDWPELDDKVSALVSEGSSWLFPQHRSVSVRRGPEPVPRFPTASPSLIDRLAEIPINHARLYGQVYIDDVRNQILSAAPGKHYNILGAVMKRAAQKGLHKVAPRRSSVKSTHAHTSWVYELTLPKEC